MTVRFAFSKDRWRVFAGKKGSYYPVLLHQRNSINKSSIKFVGIGRTYQQTGLSWCGINLTLKSLFIPMSKRCFAEIESHFTEGCSTVAFPFSMSIDSFQRNSTKCFFLCAKFLVVFNCSLPLGVWWSHRWFVFLSCSTWMDLCRSPELDTIVWHRFLSVRGTINWERIDILGDGCSCGALVSRKILSKNRYPARFLRREGNLPGSCKN